MFVRGTRYFQDEGTKGFFTIAQNDSNTVTLSEAKGLVGMEEIIKGDSKMRKYGFLASCIVIVFGLIWSNLALALECKPDEDCKELVVLAKTGFSDVPYCFECSKQCTEKGCDDIIIGMKRKVTLNPKGTEIPPCDEALQCIPPNSIMDVGLTYHIRLAGPCGTPVGTHEGKFTIYSGTTGKKIASGKMKGTNGLETHEDTQECCYWPHDEGCMESKNVKCGEKGICKLTATYSSNLGATGTADLCDRASWTNWTLNIDGILLCECEETDLD